MIIEKTAINNSNGKKAIFFYDSARTAERLILSYLHKEEFTLFLPGYIGYSVNEGSGIFDPVVQTQTEYIFYKIKRNISIDVDDLSSKLENTKGFKVVFIVNYFGYPDVKIKQIVDICKKNEALIIEDCAHALYTDYIDHKCGFYGDYAIYSIHKMLPYKSGGFLKVNKNVSSNELNYYAISTANEYKSIFNYDLFEIAMNRKKNAETWKKLCKHNSKIELLHDSVEMVTPQTFPLIIKEYDRTKLYFELNKAGFGAVSLYHTMIEPLSSKEFEEARWLSNHIINMPVHQDIGEGQIQMMYKKMVDLIGE